MSTGRKRIIVGALALTAGLAVGCGGSSDDTTEAASNPEDTVQAFYDASMNEDAAGACGALSSESQDIAAAGADSCEAAFETAVKSGSTDVPKDFTIDGSSIDGDTATVDVTGDGNATSFSLVNEDGWKIDLTAAVAPTDSSTGVTDSTTG